MNIMRTNEKVKTIDTTTIFTYEYQTSEKINILSLIDVLQKNGYTITDVGVLNKEDMYEKKLYPSYDLDSFAINYNNILDSEEYDGTELVVPVGEVLAHVTVKDNYIKVFSYDQPISLEDLLKKNEYSPLKRT